MPKKSETHCCVLKCNNNGKNKPEISFFNFPDPSKEKDRFGKWLQFTKLSGMTNNQVYKSMKICADHFENNQFFSVFKKKLVGKIWIPSIIYSDDVNYDNRDANNNDISLNSQPLCDKYPYDKFSEKSPSDKFMSGETNIDKLSCDKSSNDNSFNKKFSMDKVIICDKCNSEKSTCDKSTQTQIKTSQKYILFFEISCV